MWLCCNYPVSRNKSVELFYKEENRSSFSIMDKLIITVVAILFHFQSVHGGYIQSGYYPSAYPTFVGQSGIPQSFLRPAQLPLLQVQQKRPLQLRPAVALPNTRPAVVAIHAERPQQIVSASVPVSSISSLPVVAIQAQQQLAAQVVSVPNYSFGYAVKDAVTGDEKSHEETRTGDNVVGKYTVVEPDGTLRTVTFTAGVNGFNAIVERTPGYAPPNAPAKVIAVSKPITIAPPPSVVAVSRPVSISRPVTVFPNPNPALIQPSLNYPYPAGFHFGG